MTLSTPHAFLGHDLLGNTLAELALDSALHMGAADAADGRRAHPGRVL
ncbi:hypothetical protein [Streptomyces sp. NPDC007883]